MATGATELSCPSARALRVQFGQSHSVFPQWTNQKAAPGCRGHPAGKAGKAGGLGASIVPSGDPTVWLSKDAGLPITAVSANHVQ